VGCIKKLDIGCDCKNEEIFIENQIRCYDNDVLALMQEKYKMKCELAMFSLIIESLSFY